jgi:hypothetical protein
MTKQLYEGRVVIGPCGDVMAVEDFVPSKITEEQIRGDPVRCRMPVQMSTMQMHSEGEISRWEIVVISRPGMVRSR